MQRLIREFVESGKPSYVVSSAHPRLVNRKPRRIRATCKFGPTAGCPRRILRKWHAPASPHLSRSAAFHPVNAVLPGRRNNPPETSSQIRSLAMFSPIHYLELPELFMGFICSMTGKSPSTTGAGSEGALTKGLSTRFPHHRSEQRAGLAAADGEHVSSRPRVCGPHVRVDHDVSLLVRKSGVV